MKKISLLLIAVIAISLSYFLYNDSQATQLESSKEIALQTLSGQVFYRERSRLPPGSELKVYLEDVSRMDVAAIVLAKQTFTNIGAPPYAFTLEYDASKITERGRYGLRARIENNGQLLFINDTHIAAFGEQPEGPIEVLVIKVTTTNSKSIKPADKPSASLTGTYWKLLELNGEPAVIGAKGKELSITLVRHDNKIRGFSGCNNIMGNFEIINGGTLLFSQLASSRKLCAAGMQQESTFMAMLESVKSFQVTGDTMTLNDSGRRVLLRFKAVYF